MQSETTGKSWGLLSSLLLVSLVFLLTWARYRPPAPRPVDAPASEFSAGRARQALSRLVGDGAPHFVGSAANEQVRGRVLAELAALGYDPQIQQAFACNSWGTCAAVKNVVARLPGRQPPAGDRGSAVLLAAHYDSVPAGPGASDDGAGVAAVLEIARILKAAPPRRTVIFLIDDGEEAGLLGAQAFVDEHPWAKEVGAAVNLEARGTSGPSLMFETGSDTESLMRLYSGTVSRPMTSSLYYTVYKRLPNDTDFTVFKATGYQGFNFAYIGDVMRYHTPLDNFANADSGSLQHHGDNGLATVRALADAEVWDPGKGEAGFFDVFALGIARWPLGWTLPVAILNAVFFLLVVLRLARRDIPRRVFSLVWGFVGWLGMILLSAVLAAALSRALAHSGAFASRWLAHPVPAKVAFAALGFLIPVLCAIIFFSQAEFWGLWSGIWLWWALLALGISAVAPGMSYIFLVPALVATLSALVMLVRENDGIRAAAAAIPAACAAWMIFSVVWFLYDAVGVVAFAIITTFVALLGVTLLPLLVSASRGWRWSLALIAAVAMIVAALQARRTLPFSESSPERTNIVYYQDADGQQAQWLVFPDSESLRPELRQVAQFDSQPMTAFPWRPGHAFRAAAAPAETPAPELSILEDSTNASKRTVRALLRSPRGAPVAAVLFSPATKVESFTMQGKQVPELSQRGLLWTNGWKEYSCLTMPTEGVEVSFRVSGETQPEIVILDESPGLPPAGNGLLQARPATAIPSQHGDVAIFSRHVRLSP